MVAQLSACRPLLALGLLLLALAIGGGWFPDTAVAIYSLGFAVLALGWSGRAAWLAPVIHEVG